MDTYHGDHVLYYALHILEIKEILKKMKFQQQKENVFQGMTMREKFRYASNI